jgi:3-dehydroquinate synthase
MSDLKASVSETNLRLSCRGLWEDRVRLTFVDGVFGIANSRLADCCKVWGRVIAVTDKNVCNLYGDKMERYFQHYGLSLKLHTKSIGGKAKTLETFLEICDSMNMASFARYAVLFHQIERILIPHAGTGAGGWRRPRHGCCRVR